MIRKDKYVLFKHTDIIKYLEENHIKALGLISNRILSGRRSEGKKDIEAVVVESDWPMYEDTWKSIEEWVDNKELKN